MSPDVGGGGGRGDVNPTHTLLEEVKRVGARAKEGYIICWCDNCNLPFCIDERGIRCRTIKGDCTRFYCQSCEFPPQGDRYLCSLCGNYSCELHGRVCQEPSCTRALCQACENVCTVCALSVCVLHCEFLPIDDGVMCVTCVKTYYPKRHKITLL